jgi:hypothetical protein
MLVTLFCLAFAFAFACSLTPKTKQSNKNNNHPKTKATATDQRNKILHNKSFAAAAAAAAVLFPVATTHYCATHQSFPLQQKKSSRSKQANLLTSAAKIPFIHILTTTKRR